MSQGATKGSGAFAAALQAGSGLTPQGGPGRGRGRGRFAGKRKRSDSAAGSFVAQLLQAETWAGARSVEAARRCVRVCVCGWVCRKWGDASSLRASVVWRTAHMCPGRLCTPLSCLHVHTCICTIALQHILRARARAHTHTHTHTCACMSMVRRRFVGSMGHAPSGPHSRPQHQQKKGARSSKQGGGGGSGGAVMDDERAMWAMVQVDGASVSPAIAPLVQQQQQQPHGQGEVQLSQSLPQLSSLFDVECAASWHVGGQAGTAASRAGAPAGPAGGQGRARVGGGGKQQRKKGDGLKGAVGGVKKQTKKQRAREVRLLQMESGQGPGSGKNRGRKARSAKGGKKAQAPQAPKKRKAR